MSCGFLRFVRGIPDDLHYTDNADEVCSLDRRNQLDLRSACREFRLDVRVARQMKMRRAVARSLAAWEAAESHALPFRIAAIGIAAVTASEIDQRDVAWIDF